jgi:hypothetical protein
VAADFVHLRVGGATGFLEGGGGLAARFLDFAMRLAPSFVNLLLRGAANLVQLSLKRRLNLADLRFGPAPDLVGVPVCRFAKKGDLRLSLVPDLGSSRFRGVLRRASALVSRDARQLVCKSGELRVQMRPHGRRGTVERLANVFVERHGSKYCT